MAALVAQIIKNLPVMQQTWVQSLGQEYSLEKNMHSDRRKYTLVFFPGESHGHGSLAGYSPCHRITKRQIRLNNEALTHMCVCIYIYIPQNLQSKSCMMPNTCGNYYKKGTFLYCW